MAAGEVVVAAGATPELLAVYATLDPAAVAGKRLYRLIVIGICRRCRLRWLPGCHRAGSETAAVSVQPFLLRFELLRLLRKWLGTEVLAVGILIVDLGLRRKGFCDAFGLWICVLR
ncbi:uncharacterized protein DS421_13g419480 [Arachis hypogaea]|nr:uncharacterized protein DS421_13g419480 [Arachis hypogaea]